MELIIFVLIIIFFSSLIRSVFGFGDALVAMPLLSLIMPVKYSTPIVAIIAIFLSLSIIIKEWDRLSFKNVYVLILFSLIGIPIGIYLLDNVSEAFIKILLGLILISFSLFNLISPNLFELKSKKFDWLFGLISGILGGAYNTNGPPIIVYGTLKKWDAGAFRTNLQAVFMPTNLFIISGHFINGNVTQLTLKYLIYSIPSILLAFFIGNFLRLYIDKTKFIKYIFIILIILGLMMFIQAIF